MATALRATIVLFGPRKGQTIRINGHMFTDGKVEIIASGDKLATCIKGMSYYGAFAMGTDEYRVALAKEAAENGNPTDAKPEVHEGQGNEFQGFAQQAGSGPTQEAPASSDGPAQADEGQSSYHPSGDGHENTGVPKFEEKGNFTRPTEPSSDVDLEVQAALRKLDVSVDGHWTKAGIPALMAVEEAMGRAGVTRKDVENSLPGYTRETATAL